MIIKVLIQMLSMMFLIGSILSQSSSINFSISSSYGDTILNLKDGSFATQNSEHLQITTLRFYISDIHFMENDKIVLVEKNSFHLFDAESQEEFQFSIPNEDNLVFDQLVFNLGIDSTTNVAGVMGGDLDPTKGMYWTWQSGYINFKLEGTSNQCDTRNNEFVFHLGGYLLPNSCLQTLTFPVNNKDQIRLRLDVKSILDQVELQEINHIMSPSKEAVVLSETVARAFKILD